MLPHAADGMARRLALAASNGETAQTKSDPSRRFRVQANCRFKHIAV